MSEITFNCPSCGQEYTVDGSLGGKVGLCEVCDHEFHIPDSDADANVAVEPVEMEPRTRDIGKNIIDLVREIITSPDLPWPEKSQLLKRLDLSVVAFRDHLENLEEQRKFDAQMKG